MEDSARQFFKLLFFRVFNMHSILVGKNTQLLQKAQKQWEYPMHCQNLTGRKSNRGYRDTDLK